MPQTNGRSRNASVIKIIETNLGPMISESRASVYDVMEVYDQGVHPADIPKIYNLSPHQVKVALEYIEAHREQLEPELKEILIKKAEREKYHRALIAEVEKQRPVKMTPERAKLQALIKERRQAWGINDADHSE